MSLENWRDETRSAYLYRVVADCERGTVREALFRELAGEAEKQAAIWANKSPVPIPRDVRDMRTRIVAALVRRYGPRARRGLLAAMKVRGLSLYIHANPPGHQAPRA